MELAVHYQLLQDGLADLSKTKNNSVKIGNSFADSVKGEGFVGRIAVDKQPGDQFRLVDGDDAAVTELVDRIL